MHIHNIHTVPHINGHTHKEKEKTQFIKDIQCYYYMYVLKKAADWPAAVTAIIRPSVHWSSINPYQADDALSLAVVDETTAVRPVLH